MSKNGQQRGYTRINRDTQGSTVIMRHKPSVIATTTGYSGKIRGFTETGVSPEHHRRNWCKLSLIALSHIHVSAAYRSRMYEIFDTTRSEPYFVRATYVARRGLRLTFLLRSRVVSVTYQYSYEISLSYVVRRIKANVLLTYAVYMAYKMYA